MPGTNANTNGKRFFFISEVKLLPNKDLMDAGSHVEKRTVIMVTTTFATLTLVTTDKMATALRISCHAPMFRALDATGRLNWVVNFQASTLISRMLLNKARRGAKGNEATNNVMNPNCTTETAERAEMK